jgi:hypothetical protein
MTRLFSIIFTLPGTAWQYQNAGAVPRVEKTLWLRPKDAGRPPAISSNLKWEWHCRDAEA